MNEKKIELKQVTEGKYQGLFRLRIKSKYITSFILNLTNLEKLERDLLDIKMDRLWKLSSKSD